MEEVGPNARLVFINGQAVPLRGDSDLSNISPDVLQQGLQGASEAVVARSEEDVVETITPSDVSEQTEETEPAPAETQQTAQYAQVSPGNVASFVAIIHGEHGDSQTIPLTQEQVAALGLQGGEAHVEATRHMEEAPAEGDETMMETELASEPEPEVGMVQVPEQPPPQPQPQLQPQNMRSRLQPKPSNGTAVTPVTEGQQGLMVRTVQLPQTTTANTTRTTITQVAPGAVQPPRVSLVVTPAPTIPEPPQKIPVQNFNSDKPLGSSENPIELIQQGNVFQVNQPISTQLLHQITTVYRHMCLQSQSSPSRNVIHDNETNTRIIYTVVQQDKPDLNLRNKADVTTTISPQSGAKCKGGHPPKSVSIQKSPEADPEEETFSGPELSREKKEKKKQLIRTRSGRLSRPPRHMIRDYKSLHHLDFSEPDLDDSDAGYSDFQFSEGEMDEEDELPPVLPGIEQGRRRLAPHYLGRARMATHFDMFPNHGTISDFPAARQAASDLNQPQDTDESTQDPPQSSQQDQNGLTIMKNKRRGRYAYPTPEEKSQRRKEKLQEMLSQCTLEEILEVAGPNMAASLSLADFLCLRCKHGYPDQPAIMSTHQELVALLPTMRALGQQQLQAESISTSDRKESAMTMTIEDGVAASILGMEVGSHTVSVPKAVMNPKDETQEPVQQVQYIVDASDNETVAALAMLLDSGNPAHHHHQTVTSGDNTIVTTTNQTVVLSTGNVPKAGVSPSKDESELASYLDLPEEGEEPTNNPADQHTQEPAGSRNDDGTQMTLDPETGVFVPVATEPQGHESAGDHQEVPVFTPAIIDFDALIQWGFWDY